MQPNNTSMEGEQSDEHQSSESLCNTHIILDWDDTIFPTSVLKQISKRTGKKAYIKKSYISSRQYNQLTNLSMKIYQLLTTYILQYGATNIIIVSASTQGWIQQSLAKLYKIGYFYQIYQLLFSSPYKISMIHPSESDKKHHTQQIGEPEHGQRAETCGNGSASSVYIFDSAAWKEAVFKQLFVDRYISNTDIITTFVIIGDSEYEFNAAKNCKKLFASYGSNIFIDRIQLINKPSIKDQMKQFDLLLSMCGKYELNSKLTKQDITIDYMEEMMKLRRKFNNKSASSTKTSTGKK